MATDKTIAEVSEIVKDTVGRDQLPGQNESLISYGADSLDTVEVVMAVEEFFGVFIEDALVDGLETVAQIADLVEKLQSD